jgi:hypothetical protein
MAMPATLTPLAAELPVAWTTGDLTRWLDSLSPRERAELQWTRPRLRAALDELLVEPLTAEAIDGALSSILRVLLACRRVLPKLAGRDVPIASIVERLRQRLRLLSPYFKSEGLLSQLDLVARAIGSYVAAIAEQEPMLHKLADVLESEQDLDSLVDRILADRSIGILKAEAFLMALFEAAERGLPAAHARSLGGLAVAAMVDGIIESRSAGISLLLDPADTAEQRHDKIFDGLVRAALQDVEERTPAGTWVRGFLPKRDPPGFVPALRSEQPKMYREVGRVAGVEFDPAPIIALRFDDSIVKLGATPALIEQALSLRGVPVRAMYLAGPVERIVAYVYGGTGGKLVRLAPSGAVTGVRPDLAIEGTMEDAAWAATEISDADLKGVLLAMPDGGEDADFELPPGSVESEAACHS